MNRTLSALALVCLLLASFSGGEASTPKTSDAGVRGGEFVGRPVDVDTSWCLPCPVPPLPVPADSSVIALKKTEVRIRVLGPFADVEVIQHYHNPASFPVTVGYTFPLPGDAALRDLKIVTNGRTLTAELKELAEARRIYDEAESAGHGAVLVEQARENVFRARIANVPPGRDLAVRLVYAQRIPFEGGRYRLLFPTVVAPRYCPSSQPDRDLFALPYVPSGLPGHSIEIEAEIQAGAPLLSLSSPSHSVSVNPASGDAPVHVELARQNETPNRDFVLTWTPRDDRTEARLWRGPSGPGGTPFLLVMNPGRRLVAAVPRREIVFILDSSGSMSGPKFDAALRAVKGLLRGLGPDDSFRLVEFDDDYTTLSSEALRFGQDSLDRADAWLSRLEADGGTEILEPVKYALRLAPDRNRERIVILLTDGQVGNEEQVLAEVNRSIGRARIFTLGIDYAVNDEMLRSMARVGRGSCILTTPDEDVEGAILALKNRFTAPVVSDMRLEFGRIEIHPDPMPDLFEGEPLAILGRITGPVPAEAVLHGRQGGEAWSSRLVVTGNPVEELNLDAVVAEKELEELRDKMRGGDAEALKRRMIEISLRHRVSSPFTAFVVVETREEVTDTGLVRRVEVPVAFPEGWNWSTVFGDDESGMMPGGGWAGKVNGLACYSMAPCAAPAPMARRAAESLRGRSDADASTLAPQTLALRYLARTQRADGFWRVAGRDDLKATALAVIGLLRQYATFRNECDRALNALASASVPTNDAVTAALVKAALETGGAASGNAAFTNAAARISAPAAGAFGPDPASLASSARVEDLAAFAAACRSLPGAALEAPRSGLATALAAQVETTGTEAGRVARAGVDPVLATALYAALGN